jgi:hypothetical protein
MKALVGGSDDRIHGFTMIGCEAGEVMVAVWEAPRRRSRPPDQSGRTRFTLFECAVRVRTRGYAKK